MDQDQQARHCRLSVTREDGAVRGDQREPSSWPSMQALVVVIGDLATKPFTRIGALARGMRQAKPLDGVLWWWR